MRIHKLLALLVLSFFSQAIASIPGIPQSQLVLGYFQSLFTPTAVIKLVNFDGSAFSLVQTISYSVASSGNYTVVRFHPRLPMFAAGTGDPNILRTYSVTSSSATLLSNVSSASFVRMLDLAWNSDGTRIAVLAVIGSTITILVYNVDQNTGALTFAASTSTGVIGSPSVADIVWDPTDTYLAVNASASTTLRVYQFDPAYSSLISAGQITTAGGLLSLDWGPHSSYILAGISSSPFLAVYEYIPNVVTPSSPTFNQKLQSVTPALVTGASGVKWHKNGTCFACSSSSAAGIYFFDGYTGIAVQDGMSATGAAIKNSSSVYINQWFPSSDYFAYLTGNTSIGVTSLLSSVYACPAFSQSSPQFTTTQGSSGGTIWSFDVRDFTFADLTINKSVSTLTPNPGQTITYTITVANLGISPIGNAFVEDVLPAGLTFVSSNATQGAYDSGSGEWTVGALAVGASAQLIVTVTVNANTVGQSITNTARVFDAYVQDPYIGSNVSSVTINVGTSPFNLNVAKTVNNATPSVGEQITYTVTVNNIGGSIAHAVQVTDLLPTGLSFVSSTPSQGSYAASNGFWDVGTLNVGASATLTITASVNFSAVGQTLVNTATVIDAYNSEIYTGDNSASVAIRVQQNADLVITKTVNNATPIIGQQIIYSVSVTNFGPNTASAVQVSDLLPSGLSFVTDVPSQGTYNAVTGVWEVGTLTASSTATLAITASVDFSAAGQTIVNTATVLDPYTGDIYPDSNTASVAINVQLNADLVITKIVDNATPVIGQQITYTIGVTNLGPNSAGDVLVNDLLPSGLLFVSATPSQGAYDAASGVWEVGTLTASSTATLTITASVDFSAAGQTIVNTATVFDAYTGDIYPGSNTASVGINVQSNADLVLSKIVDSPNAMIGQTLNFTLTVTNFGPNTANGVFVNDLLPADLTFVSSTPSQGNYNAITGVWDLGALTASSSATLTITATVNSSAAGQTLVNTASVQDAYTGDVYTGSNTASATVRVAPSFPALLLTLTVNNSTPTAGEDVVFTITVSNTGGAIAYGATVNNILPDGFTFVSSSASQGSFDSGTEIWDLGPLGIATSATLTITATTPSIGFPQAFINTATLFDPYGAYILDAFEEITVLVSPNSVASASTLFWQVVASVANACDINVN